MDSLAVSPSILAADFGALEDEIREVEGLVEFLHIDVMDGHFVPNITMGPVVSNSLHRRSGFPPFEVHLMISDPLKYAPMFDLDEEDTIIFHAEVTDRPVAIIDDLEELGARIGISLNPDTPPDRVLNLLPRVDQVLVMTVRPGFGGQDLMPKTLDTIRLLRKKIDKQSLDTKISVDGGINPNTVPDVVRAGAHIIVAGSAVFEKEDPAGAVRDLRAAAEDTLE